MVPVVGAMAPMAPPVPTPMLYGMGYLAGKLYQLECEVVLPSQEQAKAARENSDLWHLRLGHLSSQQLTQMVQQNLVTGMEFPI